MARDDLTRAAQALASRGVCIFPVQPGDKVPMAGIKWREASTSDAAQIEAWWGETPTANIGVDCGKSGLVVIDLDGQEALGHWRELIGQHGRPEDTVMVMTGREGGLHLWYRGTGVKNSASKLAPKVDVRGEGGFVVAPPSLHPSGSRYRWHPRSAKSVGALPQWVAELLKPKPTPVTVTTRASRDDEDDSDTGQRTGAEVLDRACNDIRCAPQGTRNNTLNTGAFLVGQWVGAGQLMRGSASEALKAAARQAGLPEYEIKQTIESGLRAGEAHPAVVEPQQPRRRGVGLTFAPLGATTTTP